MTQRLYEPPAPGVCPGFACKAIGHVNKPLSMIRRSTTTHHIPRSSIRERIDVRWARDSEPGRDKFDEDRSRRLKSSLFHEALIKGERKIPECVC